MGVEAGRWKAPITSRNGPRVSHHFFANDLLLFAKASEDQAQCINRGLELCCKASSQRVNFAKSLIYFSPFVPEQNALNLSQYLGIPKTEELERYLGH